MSKLVLEGVMVDSDCDDEVQNEREPLLVQKALRPNLKVKRL